MIFGRTGKLSPQYISAFEVLDDVGRVVYRLALPPSLSGVHLMFHASMLTRFHGEGDYIIKLNSVFLDNDLTYKEELVVILD